ncbi:MAG: sterol desaturase family protein, partial [Halioglobus sp.]|nr:sterol desaturase family protein [Halioglobus sp.]
NLIYQFWVHTEHIGKLGWFEWFFVSPSNHRVHHAQNDRYLDRNYGGLFILWDRLFGTFQEELDEEPVVFGIRGPLRSFNPVKALTHIYVDMARDSWHTRRWRDKVRVWVARTGWRPADVAARFPVNKPDLAQFQRYDPVVHLAVSVYAAFQLLAVVALLVFMQFNELAYWPGVMLWAFILATTVLTALWLEGRAANRLLFWECLRIIVAAGGALFALAPAALAWFYCVLNLFWLVILARRDENAGPLPAH